MFTMSPFWEKYFYIFTWVTQGSSYLNARAYAILHRMHHAYRNFPGEKDQSKNTLFIDFLMLGELFQNNHHHAGARPNFAAKWWEIDPVYPIIKLFNKLGIIKLIPLKY